MVVEKIINENKPLLVLIHGGNSSPSEWKEHVEALKDNFSLWLITIPGHGKDHTSPYEAIRVNAVNFLNEIKKEYNECYVYGRGLGGQIAVAMCLEDGNFVKKAIFESTLCITAGLLTFAFRLNSRLSYRPNIEDVEKGLCLSKQNYALMVRDNTAFALDNRVNECNTSVYVLYSENDDKLISKSADHLCGYFKNSTRAKYQFGHHLGITHFKEIFPSLEEFLLKN